MAKQKTDGASLRLWRHLQNLVGWRVPTPPRRAEDSPPYQVYRGFASTSVNYLSRSYWRRLNERTLSEMQIYERTRRELEKETRPEIWEQKNESLRILGLRTIPAPNE